MRVMAGVAEILSSPPANWTAPLRACSSRSFHPAAASSSRAAGTVSLRPCTGGTSRTDVSVARARGRFHGSLPGARSRVISRLSAAPSVTPGAPYGSRYSVPAPSLAIAFRELALISRAAITLPARAIPPSSMRVSMISPSSTSAYRPSPIPRSISHSGNVVSRRLQQHPSLGERQPDNVRIASGDVVDIDFAIALQRIAASLAAPFAVARVIIDLGVAEAFHRDHRFTEPLAYAFPRNRERDPRQHT